MNLGNLAASGGAFREFLEGDVIHGHLCNKTYCRGVRNNGHRSSDLLDRSAPIGALRPDCLAPKNKRLYFWDAPYRYAPKYTFIITIIA